MSNKITITLPAPVKDQDSWAIYVDTPGSRRIYGETWFAYDWLPQLVKVVRCNENTDCQ